MKRAETRGQRSEGRSQNAVVPGQWSGARSAPRHTSRVTRHLSSAFSLIEIMVAVALMSFIVLGLLIAFNQVSRVFRSGMTQVDILAGGRTIMDTIMRDLEQMTPSGTPNTLNFSAEGSLLFTPPLVQTMPPDPVNGPKRTNAIQKLFFLTRYNQDWTGTGYEVLDNYGAGCVGSLYRFTTNGRANVSSMSLSFRAATSSNLNLVADGIVSFRITAFATNGFPVVPNINFPNPTNGVFQNAQTGNSTLVANTSANWDAGIPSLVNSYFVSNAVPGYVEVELGMLEPQILERFRSIGNPAAQRAYLEQHVAQVHVFRQRVAVRNVDFSAYIYP